MTLWKISIAIAIFLEGFLGLLHPVSAQISSTTEANPRPPHPPRTPPVNAPRPGGGLNPDTPTCSPLNDELQALIPIENPVLTATAYPTFLFYVPFAAEDVQFGEFSLLLWPGEEIRHYKTRFALPDSPGIVSVSLPEQPEYALAEDQTYRWYFQLHCQTGKGTQPEISLNGAIQRVALTPERAQQIQAASPDIWYDALANSKDSGGSVSFRDQ